MDHKRLRERIVQGFSVEELEIFIREVFPEIGGGLAGIVAPSHDLNYRAHKVVEYFNRRGRLPELEARVNVVLGPPGFDVALSFAGEDRSVAEALTMLLVDNGISVFYDRDFTAELLGTELEKHLRGIYAKARFAVAIVSHRYVVKPWTQLELSVVLETEARQGRDYLLPMRLDDTPLPGLDPRRSYLDLRSTPLPQAAQILRQRVKS